MTLRWTVTERENGLQLVEAAALRIPSAPRAFVRKTCSKGRLRRAGVRLTAETLLFNGDELELSVSQRMAEVLATAPLTPDQLIFEDGHALVVVKPAGLIIHRSDSSIDSLQEKVQAFVKLRGETFRTSPVHRLDLGTSGPVLFGKGVRATGRLGRLFMGGEVSKVYLALVCGIPPEAGDLDSPVPSHGKLKPSLTRFRRLARTGQFALLQLHLETGRLHQLRRQLSEAGWPILGDRRYGGQSRPGLVHPFLHCCTLRFPGLEDHLVRQIDCPLPEPLRNLLDQLALPWPLLPSPRQDADEVKS